MDIKTEVLSRPECAKAYAEKDYHELARLLSVGRTKTIPVMLRDVDLLVVESVFASLSQDGALPADIAAEMQSRSVVTDELTQREVAIALYHDNGDPK